MKGLNDSIYIFDKARQAGILWNFERKDTPHTVFLTKCIIYFYQAKWNTRHKIEVMIEIMFNSHFLWLWVNKVAVCKKFKSLLSLFQISGDKGEMLFCLKLLFSSVYPKYEVPFLEKYFVLRIRGNDCNVSVLGDGKVLFSEIEICYFGENTIVQFSWVWNVPFSGDWNVSLSWD